MSEWECIKKGIKRPGESCTLNNNCIYPNCKITNTMNREIKFRAWDKSGEYFKPLDDDGDYYFRDDGGGITLYDKWGECKDVILLQYTGLKDKNGKEIYEGDVVNVHLFIQVLGEGLGVMEGEKEVKGRIEMWEYGWAVETGNDESFYLVYAPGMLHEESFEVIGNIYENQELVKK